MIWHSGPPHCSKCISLSEWRGFLQDLYQIQGLCHLIIIEAIKSFTLYLTKWHRFTGLNAKHSNWKKLSVNYISYSYYSHFCHYTNVTVSSEPLCVSPFFVSLSICFLSVGCAGVFIPPTLHMVKISEENSEPSGSGLGPWHCPGLGVGHCLSRVSLWRLSALKNLFVYPHVRSSFRSWALLRTVHQRPGLLPLATDKNCC